MLWPVYRPTIVGRRWHLAVDSASSTDAGLHDKTMGGPYRNVRGARNDWTLCGRPQRPDCGAVAYTATHPNSALSAPNHSFVSRCSKSYAFTERSCDLSGSARSSPVPRISLHVVSNHLKRAIGQLFPPGARVVASSITYGEGGLTVLSLHVSRRTVHVALAVAWSLTTGCVLQWSLQSADGLPYCLPTPGS